MASLAGFILAPGAVLVELPIIIGSEPLDDAEKTEPALDALAETMLRAEVGRAKGLGEMRPDMMAELVDWE